MVRRTEMNREPGFADIEMFVAAERSYLGAGLAGPVPSRQVEFLVVHPFPSPTGAVVCGPP